MGTSTNLTIVPVLPKGPGVVFDMIGSASFGPADASSEGGWQIFDRPRQKAIVQWYDASPMQLDLELLLDGAGGSIEPQAHEAYSWQYPKAGQQQPPVLAIEGPVDQDAKNLYWVLYTVKFDDDKVIRLSNGDRTQQNVSISLYEYLPATASVLTHQSPAKAAQKTLSSQGTQQSRRTYVVRTGDSLASIAAVQLGDYTLWPQIASLNNVRDPRSSSSLSVGQRVLLPA